MNISIFAILVLIHFSLFAQNHPAEVYATGNETASSLLNTGARHRVSTDKDLATAHQQRQQHLNRQLQAYNLAPEGHQADLQEQIRTTLTEMMDISLQMQEEEVRQLAAEWKALKAGEGTEARLAYMQELESRIAAVNARIKNRRNLMTEIVNRRLEELIK